jgi:sigma-B regulation protein RsbU (phosphoserine phosphatase)
MDLEKRAAAIRTELNSAAAAQRWIMPSRAGRFGKFATLGESRPGQLIGGDFFDLIDLGNGRLAVALGDVSGKGIVASVLMTAAQGYFHAAITRRGDLGEAVTDLNNFVIPRRPECSFLTMWVGLFDAARRTIQYVDAGHGYALRKRGSDLLQLNEGLGMPIGVTAQKYTAETIDLADEDQVLIVSDGFVEQTSPSETRDEFGLDGVKRALCDGEGGDPVERLFRALIGHAGSTRLADDATAVLIRCCGQ